MLPLARPLRLDGMTSTLPVRSLQILVLLVSAALVGACSDESEFARVDPDAEVAADATGPDPFDLVDDGRRRDTGPGDGEDSVRAALEDDDPDADLARATADELVVRVVGLDGAPVFGADVWLFEPREAESEHVLHAMGAGQSAEVFLAGHGRRERTDDDGTVRTESFVRRGLVGARVGDAWGSARVNVGSTEVTVALELDAHLLVRVVDPNGQPLPGVPVALAEIDRNRVRRQRSVETGDDGLATFSNPRDFFELARRDSEFIVLPVVPQTDPAFERIEPDALPDEPLELVLGATSSLRVQLVEDGGEPFTGRGVLTARARESRWRTPYEVRLDGESSAVIPFLEPGLPVRLEFRREGSRADYDLDVVAPPVPAVQGDVRFVLVPTHPVLVARLVDDLGEPLVDERVRYSVEQAIGEVDRRDRRRGRDRDTGEQSLTTDENGVLRVDLPDNWVAGTAAFQADVRTVDPGGEQSELLSATFLVEPPLVDGINDVGLVILRPPPLLVAGVVVDQLGVPIADALVSLHVLTVDDDGRERWNRVADLDTRSDENGAFHVTAWSPDGALGVRASSRDHVRAEIVPCAAGAANLRLELIGAGAIAGTLEAPTSVDVRRFTLLAVPGAPRVDDLRTLWRAANGRARPRRGSGDFRIDRLEPGSYTVCVLFEDLPGVLVALGGIRVATGEVARPAGLDPVDLRSVLRVFDLRLLFADGRPVPWARLRWRAAGDESWASADIGRGGRTTIVADASIIDVHAITRGVAPTLFEGVSSSRDLTFQAPLDVRVRVDAGLLPDMDRYTFAVQLVPLSWEGARTTANLDTQGRGRFASAGPGPHRVVFSVRRRDSRASPRTFTAEPAEEVELDPYAAEIVLRPTVPKARLERALERLR